jgi:transcription antitermination protein NusB
MNRKKEREIIVLSLYSMELSDNDAYETVNYVLEQNNVSEPATPYILESITGINQQIEKIDEIISDNLENYHIDRLSFLDLAIIRFATYEMMNQKDVAVAIVINEAVEITKKYTDLGDNKAAAFNNSVLDKIKKSLQLV